MMQFIAVACGVLAAVQSVQADETTIGAAKDNTLYEDAKGRLSNGAGEHFFAGKTGAFNNFLLRRGLISFDIAGSIPEGSTITSVTLTLHLSAAAPGSGNQPVSLHRLLADWGEGDSDAAGSEGAGAPAAPGDATWLHTFFDTEVWARSGGDFDDIASAVTLVGTAMGEFPTWSTPQMASDVQDWLDDPTGNFGWLVLGNEDENQTARRFDTHEHPDPDLRPLLHIEFETAEPCPWDLDGNNDVGVGDLLVLLGAWGANPGHPADFDGNGAVGVSDLLALLANWGPCP